MMRVKLLYQTRISSQAETSTASNNGIPLVSVACRSSRPDLFQWAAVMPPFIHRSFSTAENLVESASQDSSACVSDVAPRIKFKRLDKTAKHIMQACILALVL
jgi:large subunit ribosomal protein L19